MKWQEINKKTIALSAAGVFGLIFMISQLTGVDVGYTNWEDCINGTDCYARFDVNTSYYRICFNIDDTVETPHYFKKQNRSRTIWVNTSRYGFVTTEPDILTILMMGTTKSIGIVQAPDGKWLRDVKTGDCIERKKTNYLYVKGAKDPYINVTWKMDLFEIDPIWKSDETKGTLKVLYNTDQCLINCHTVYEYTPGKNHDSDFDVKYYDKKAKQMDKHKVEKSVKILENVTKQKPIKECKLVEVTIEKIVFNNETKKNETIKVKVNQTECEIVGYKEYYELVEKTEKIKEKKFKKDEKIIFRVSGKKKPFENVDNVVTLDGKEWSEYAWWNSSWEYKREVTISTDYNYTHYPANFSINLSTEYSAGKVNQTCKDIRFSNSTDTGELYYDIVICDLSVSDIATFSVHLDEITTDNETIYMYYGSNDAETTEDYFNTYWRHNNNLVLDYPMKLGSGYVAWDVSGEGNNGTLAGDASWLSGQGMQFSGTGYLDTNSNETVGNTTQFMISTWVNLTTTTGNNPFYCSWAGGNSIIHRVNGGNLQLYINTVTSGTVGLTSQSYTTTNQKVNMIAWYNGSIMKTYVDGVESGTTAGQTGTVSIGGVTERIGRYAAYYFVGKVYNTIVYNTTLTPTQISLLYNETKYPPIFSFGAEEEEVTGIKDVNVSLSSGINAFEFRPVWIDEQNVNATNQTDSIGVLNITSNGTAVINTVGIRVNETQSGWSIECSNASKNYIILNTSYQTIYNSLAVNNSFMAWCRIDLDFPNETWGGKVEVNATG